MSHEIETMFSVREKPWHYEYTKDATKIIQEAPTSAEALKAAGLDWTVYRKLVFDEYGREIPGYRMNVRDKDERILGVVSDRYSLIQNKEAFEFTDSLLGEGITYETAGSLRGGKQIWLLAKMPERELVGDKLEPYLCFTNSHDGSGAVRVCMTPIRVVCNNTLNLALNGAARCWSAPHRGDIQRQLEAARATLRLANHYLTRLDEVGDQLANESMTEGEMRDTLDRLFPVNEDDSDRVKETLERKKDQIIVCTLAPDLLKFANTKWAFINGVADFIDHTDPLRKTKHWQEHRWDKIMTGSGLLDRALKAVS